MAATWLTRFEGLKTRIIDKEKGPVLVGQADGLQCRTLEVLQSFGLADFVLKQAHHILEVSLYLIAVD
jgi:phenol 2-monooxygenase (NADPH)